MTGGCGFIGSNLVRRLLAASHEVSVIDDLSTGFRCNIEMLSDSIAEASVLDIVRLAHTADGADAIVHLAALGSVPRSVADPIACLLYTSPSPRDRQKSRMPSSA